MGNRARQAVCGAPRSALDLLAGAEKQESFVRTFAYASGPAYGLLLDASSPQWRSALRGSDDVTFTGDAWTFKAAPGWIVREGARRGDYQVVRQQP